MIIYFKKKAQIGALLFDNAFIKILAEYSNYNNIFFVENVTELPKNSKRNKHFIKLKKDKQPLFKSIYNLKLIKLEILKTYTEINLANDFIQSFKFFTGISIFFN